MNHGSKYVYVGAGDESSDEDEVSDSELDKGILDVMEEEEEEEEEEDEDQSSTKSSSSSGVLSGLLSSIRRLGASTSTSTSRPRVKKAQGEKEAAKESANKDKEVQNKTSKKRQVKKAKTNVVSIALGTLASEATKISTGDPLFCSHCKAGFNVYSVVSEEKIEGEETTHKNWKCEFCGETNKDVSLSPEELPSAESMDYLIEPALETSNSSDESSVIFCLDTSGSMCVTTEVQGKLELKGDRRKQLEALNTERTSQRLPREQKNVTYVSRLQSLQAAVDAAMNKLATESPHKKVGLVTFNNEVNLIGDGTSKETKIITGDRLSNYDELISIGDEGAVSKSIKFCQDTLRSKLYSLEEYGATALGPAILVSISLASLRAGSQVIVCTDGKANIGLGALDKVETEEDVNSVDSWYSQVGHYAASKGVCISVISIKGDDCRMEYLGKLSELTGGGVEIVNPLEITTQFSNILSKSIIATNTRCTVHLHKGLHITENAETGQGSNHIVRDMGNIVSDTEFTFEYAVNKKEAGEIGALPFQVQIEYQRTNGAKMMRIITQVQQTTSVRIKAEEEANVVVLATHMAQQTAQLAQEGEYGQARMVNIANARMFKRAAKTEEKKKVVQNWAKAADALNRDISTAVSSEKERGDYYSDDEDEYDDAESKRRVKEKKNYSRKRERNDGHSNNMYQMKQASSSWWSK